MQASVEETQKLEEELSRRMAIQSIEHHFLLYAIKGR